MKKEHLINAVAIFISIVGSFGVERLIEYRKEQNEIKILETNLLYELEQNYYSLISLRGTLNSVIEVSDSITINWSSIDSKKIKTFHQKNIYDRNERIEFILSNSYGFTAKNMYLNSLVNSGLILKIKSITLRTQIESINLLVNGGYFNSNQSVKDNILEWFKVKSEDESSLDNNYLFDKHKDFKLLRLLTLRRRNEIYKLSGVEANITFLKEIIKEIKEKGLF
jgi:glucosamine 6-phosphate synthetase-like amidotransferase/phosphosugar isomerase protein